MAFRDERFIPIDEREPVEEPDDFDLEEAVEESDLFDMAAPEKKRDRIGLYMAS